MDNTTSKGSLPDGWIVKVSRNVPDRVYYFNVYTGSSTWECPKLDVPGTNSKKKSKSPNVLNEQAKSKPAAARLEAKSPEFNLQIDKFLSNAKKESLKRLTDNETPSGPSKPSVPPTAIVAPVVLDKSLTTVTKKKRKKKSKRKTVAASLGAPHTPTNSQPGTILQRKDSADASKKVSFSIKSHNKIPISKSQNAILQKSNNSNPIFKKKQSLLISVPTDEKQSGASSSHEKRRVTLDKSTVLPSSRKKLGATSKEPLNRGPSLQHRFPPPQSRNGKQNSQVESQCGLSSQNLLKESNKRKYDLLNRVSGEDHSTSKSQFSYESDNGMSDMDCEMNSDFEDLLVTAPPGVNVGASTSRSSDQDSLDIEMLDMSSSDLVTIDEIFGFPGSLLDRYFIVVDTNVFIGELQYIDEMKDTPVNGCGPPHFIIPWVVFQELDSLKRNGARPKPGASKETKTRKFFDLIKTAGEAIRYLNTLLKAKHPRFHFQHPDEAEKCRKDFSRNNDDRLVECCLKLQKRISKEKVILLTNDINLANKAMVCKIVVHDRKSLLKILKPDFSVKEDPPKQISNPIYVPDPFKVLAEQKSLEAKYEADHRKCELEIDNHMSTARQMLKDVLDRFFEKEMDEAYGDPWHFFKVERHTLKGILNGILKYWRSVFAFLFSKDFKEKFEEIKKKVDHPQGFLGERTECLNILSIIDELFVTIQRKRPNIHVPATEIPKIKALTEEAFSKLSECEKCLSNVENAIKQTEMSCCIEVFNHNWTIINHLCGCASDFCGIPNDLVYDQSVPFPPKSEFLRIMPRLHNSLDQLKEVMERMLLVVKSSSPDDLVFKDLHKILEDLVPSLAIQANNICLKDFSPKLVERFCRLPENRTRIEEGYKQLLNFYEKLGKALCVLNEML